MPVEFRPIQRSFATRAGLYGEGDQDGKGFRYQENWDQDQFRRELENYLLALVVEIDGAITRLSTEASLASTREGFMILPVGRETYV
jgi:hypothetical protein